MGWPGPVTHRQFLTWVAWLDAEWNRPSKTDHYLAQVACEAARSSRKDPASVEVKQFLLRFLFEGDTPPRQPWEGQELAPGIRAPRRVTEEDVVKSAKHDWDMRIRGVNGRDAASTGPGWPEQ